MIANLHISICQRHIKVARLALGVQPHGKRYR